MGYNGLIAGGTICGVLAVGLIFFGLWGPGFIRSELSNQVDATLVVTSKDSKGYDDFIDEHTNEVPMYRYLWWFNITNHDAVYAGEKPNVVELGPYAFREYRFRHNITWEDGGKIIAFNKNATFFFDPSESCDTCDPHGDIITVPNIPMLGLKAAVIGGLGDGFWGNLAAGVATGAEMLLTNRSVYEMSFGYTDPVLKEIAGLAAQAAGGAAGPTSAREAVGRGARARHVVPSRANGPAGGGDWDVPDATAHEVAHEVAELVERGSLDLVNRPGHFPGLLGERSPLLGAQPVRRRDRERAARAQPVRRHAVAAASNGSSSAASAPPQTGFPGLSPNTTAAQTPGLIKVYSGLHNNSLVQWMLEWNGLTELSVWGSEEFNRIYGSSDGAQYQRNVERGQPIYAFVDSLFSTVKLLYEGDVTLHGITLLRHGIDNLTYANASVVLENEGRYMFGPSGVFNMTSAQGGVPIFLSKPHFLDADPIYQESVTGISADRLLHDTIVDVEPLTGNTMRARQRLQLNAHVTPTLIYGQNVRDVIVPIGWVDEASQLTPDLAKQFRNSVYLFQDIATYGGWGCLGLGIVLLITSAALLWRAFGKRQNRGRSGAGSASPALESPGLRSYRTFEDAPAENLFGAGRGGEVETLLINPQSATPPGSRRGGKKR